MQRPEGTTRSASFRVPWNEGKLIGAKPPIRTKLQVEGRKRDLAMFNLAIDSKLRGCDVVSLKVETSAFWRIRDGTQWTEAAKQSRLVHLRFSKEIPVLP